ncbi:alpha-glucan family phosphorylase [Candidatus Dojkabacteria bacterium]|nr:alpha-glucan family phosphorylase [Candidatus Dojkabacteria bacterium]
MNISAQQNLKNHKNETNIEKLELKLEKIFSNIFYTWDKDLYDFIDRLDSYDWRKTKSPTVIIHSYLEENIHKIGDDIDVINGGLEKMKQYFNSKTWFSKRVDSDPKLAKLKESPILYFSAEYGLIDWLQIYSGGLGVLAGDFVKQASDHGLPLVGIGIFYHQGYFHQDIDYEGMQKEIYIPQEPGACLLRLMRDEEGKPIEVSVRILDHDVYIRAWELKVGRTSILLLDTNYEKNTEWEDRMITAHLYGGGRDTRIRQEIVLGIGGYRFAKKLGIKSSVIHLNEGHASFVIIEELLDMIDEEGTIKEKFRRAGANMLFTNHTLNPAGNDKFSYDLIEKYLKYYIDKIGIDVSTFFRFGNDQLYSSADFSMTILGLKSTKISNAVSLLHGKAAKKVWPDYPMKAITNGVHMPTWVSKPIQEQIEKHVSKDWKDPSIKIDWDKIDNIPNEVLWEIHKNQKRQMIERINSSLGTKLDTKKLTIIWTRRFAAYKRPDVFLNDLGQLSKIVNNVEQPVQFLIGGKAHPQDLKGKTLLQRVISVTFKEEFKNKVVFLTGYNWNLAKYVVAGADVWLNNPIRFEEASGTSGMKAGANGVLQLTTLDGWTDEIDWKGKGWILPQENINKEVYKLISEEVAKTYYSNTLPNEWISMMKETMKVCLSHYNMGRMLEEYIELYKGLIK